MKDFSGSLSRFRQPRDADTLFWWSGTQTSFATSLVDDGPLSEDITTTGAGTDPTAQEDLTNNVLASADALRGSCEMNGGEKRFQFSTNAYFDEFRDDDWSFIAQVLINDDFNTDDRIFSYGGIGSLGSTANIPIQIMRDDTANALSVQWQKGTNVDVVSTSALTFSQGTNYVIGVAKEADPDNVGKIRLRMYVADLDTGGFTSETFTNVDPAENGSTGGRFLINNNGGGLETCDMQFQDMGVLNYAASEAWFREQARLAYQTYDHETGWRSASLTTFYRCFIEDQNGDMVNLDDLGVTPDGVRFLRRVYGDEDIDDTMYPFTVEVDRQVGLFNLSPYMTGSTNPLYDGGAILGVTRQIRVEIAVVPSGRDFDSVAEIEWQLFREGWTSKIAVSQSQEEPIELQCFDPMLELARTFIKTQRTYGDDTTPVVLSDVLQGYIDDNASMFKTGIAHTVWDKDSAAWAVISHTLENQHVANALINKAMDPGFDFRFIMDHDRQAYRPTLFEPDRAKTTADLVVQNSEHFGVEPLEIDETYIINACYGEFVNRAVSKLVSGDYPIARTSQTDTASITAHGERAALLTEGAGSDIDTTAEMDDLCLAVVDDGSVPKALFGVAAPFSWFTELGDVYGLVGNTEVFDYQLKTAVTGHSWELNEDGAISIWRGRDTTPVGRQKRWGERFTLPGKQRARSENNNGSPTLDATVKATSPGDVRLYMANKSYAGNGNLDRQNDQVQYHVSQAGSGFTPSASTYQGQGRASAFDAAGLTPGVDYHAKITPVDERGNEGTPSTAIAFQAWFTAPDVTPRVEAEVTGSDTATYGTSWTHVDPEQGAGGAVTVNTDNASMFTAADFELDLPCDGLHRIEFKGDFGGAGTNYTRAAVYVDEGGGSGFVRRRTGAYSPGGAAHISCEIELSQGDLVRIYVQCTTSGNRLQIDAWISYRLLQQTADVA